MSRLFFHFETCECAVMIKQTGTLHFQYRTINGSQRFPPHPRQLRRFSMLYWMNLILQSCVWTEQLPTGFIIHSSVNKLRDIYALHICCVSFTFKIAYWFAPIEHSPPMHIAWVTLTLGNRVAATGCQFFVEMNWIFALSLDIYSAHYITLRCTEELTHTHRSNGWIYVNYLLFNQPITLQRPSAWTWQLSSDIRAHNDTKRLSWYHLSSCAAHPMIADAFYPNATSGFCHTAQNPDETLRSGCVKRVDNVNSGTAYLSSAVKVEKLLRKTLIK